MPHAQAYDAFTAHYLEIQTLTPISNQAAGNLSSSLTPIPSWFPLMLIFCLAVIGFGVFMVKRYHRFSPIITVLVIGFLVGTLPLGINLLKHRTELDTTAQKETTPQAVVINRLDSRSLVVSWSTKVPTYGAVRLSPDPQMDSDLTVIRESNAGLTHNVNLAELNPQATYYLEIFSDSIWYDNHGQPLIVSTNSK